MARDTELSHLHPVVREKIQTLISRFASEELPFRLFEGFRTPDRQHELYAQGRTKAGNKVTNAKAWSSYHQYGVAGDFVLYIDGKWSWDDKGKRKQYWKRLHELAREVGLEPLSWETPHLQLQGISLAQLQAGQYPQGGDESWSENMHAHIIKWTKTATPPSPELSMGRPPINTTERPNDTSLSSATVSNRPRYQVTARNGLNMRGGPGTGFPVVATLRSNQLVDVMKTDGDWCQVDLEGDGLADGYCHSGYLAVIA
ncbi:M15 family metallopeptidase [Aliiglaciecola litoralis]|uniref:SH3b domain-containing protein n=1 Tax=Aliiglaciecola litoralis TaxID=582857 RepID=A0ABN1LCR1_9ALTE